MMWVHRHSTVTKRDKNEAPGTGSEERVKHLDRGRPDASESCIDLGNFCSISRRSSKIFQYNAGAGVSEPGNQNSASGTGFAERGKDKDGGRRNGRRL